MAPSVATRHADTGAPHDTLYTRDGQGAHQAQDRAAQRTRRRGQGAGRSTTPRAPPNLIKPHIAGRPRGSAIRSFTSIPTCAGCDHLPASQRRRDTNIYQHSGGSPGRLRAGAGARPMSTFVNRLGRLRGHLGGGSLILTPIYAP